jgi:nicotinic acid mononucleotide adenylyltransferase
MQTLRQQFFEDITHEILNRSFIKKMALNQDVLEAYVMGNHFKKGLDNMLKEKRFHARDVFALMEPLVPMLCKSLPKVPWLQYFYYHSLSYSFPEAVSITLDPTFTPVAEIYLRILRVASQYQQRGADTTWQSKYPLTLLTEEETLALEDPREYMQFKKAFYQEFVYEMMKLNQEVIGYSTLDHICGVHFMALKVARQLKNAGLPIDLGRVAGAAAGHDIGKFGCKADEMKRVAYYHYFYTGEWFEKHDIVYIRNVAINHSTWDLELEALPIESLILIYSDFRVKAEKVDNKSVMKIYDLQASFDVILEKLDNVDAAKEDRYRRVYRSLKDFEDYLIDLGVDISREMFMALNPQIRPNRKYFSLLQGAAVTQSVIYSSIEHNINLLHRLRDETSLNKMLEPVRNSRDMTNLRAYVGILEEYFNYMTQKQKQIVINFLYEKLVSPEEDIRKQCAELIGVIIAHYDEEIRKETPPSVVIKPTDFDALKLFDTYVRRFLFPENKIIDRHKKYISYSLRDMLFTFFESLEEAGKRKEAIATVISYFEAYNEDEQIRFYLVKAARILPFKEFDESQRFLILNFVSGLLDHPDMKLRLRAYNLIYTILPYASETLIAQCHITRVFENIPAIYDNPADNFARLKLAEQLRTDEQTVEALKGICMSDLQLTSNIFLSNLKTATLDIAKRFQIELLIRNTLLYDYENNFYMAMHLCNLLKVSALESVRNTAGKMLLELIPHLTFEQKNDITIELLRALEMESYEFTKYIPPYLGKIILHIKPKELDEILESFEKKMSTNNERLISLIERTIGHAISRYADYKYAFEETEEGHDHRVLRMFGILFTGFVHPSGFVNQVAFNVIAKSIFNDRALSLRKKEYLYRVTIKKIMSLMVNTDEEQDIIFYNNAASLKYIYRFVNEYQHVYGKMTLKPHNKIAFFPGAFDPFTLSHKQIATDIRDKGFEVLLYVDEFSWSKRTQPNLIRRNIIKKSVASEIDIFPFPRDISINIANPHDLSLLKELFPESEVFLVVGSDVIIYASAYGYETHTTINEIPHLIYERGGIHYAKEAKKRLKERLKRLHPSSQIVTLPKVYENISSTLIRDYIDEKRDISSLIEPLAQNYIYEKSLYQREPMYKRVMSSKAINLEIYDDVSPAFLQNLVGETTSDSAKELLAKYQCLSEREGFRVIVLKRAGKGQEVIAYAICHWLRASGIHNEFKDTHIIKYIRDDAVGRILVIDGIVKKKGADVRNLEQIVLTETLAHALAQDYTYCIYKESLRPQVAKEIVEVLQIQGFINISSQKTGESVFAVNMSSPCTVNLDIHSMFKEPYRNIPEVQQAMSRTRARLQKAFTELYPGNLVLNFDRAMIYETLIKKVCDENKVSPIPQEPRSLGNAMCVPFGAVFRQSILPNTVTKALHAEKYFLPDLSEHHIMEYPFYLDIENQIKMIKSFNRPVILVDDLLNKGYRIKALEPHFRSNDVNIQKFIVGIMSGSGKQIAEEMSLNCDAAYFIPKIKVWFYESKLYPFIDGDAIWRGKMLESNLINSVNLILPYASASYIGGTTKEAIYNLSEVALMNAIEIMTAVEIGYEYENDRLLTIDRLGEVLNTPRYPDKGNHIIYANNVKPSEYLKDDLEQLRKLKHFYIGK